ncbi:MAG: hypothetical protein QW057_05855 [Candidatus Bathyarchaeia archaeon]
MTVRERSPVGKIARSPRATMRPEASIGEVAEAACCRKKMVL